MNSIDVDQQVFHTALKNLDDAAWQTLFSAYQDRLLKDIVNSLYSRGMDHQLADDIASETWMHAIENIASLEWRGPETLYHWLRVIAYNRVRNLTRKKQPDVSLEDFEVSTSDQSGMSLDSFLWIHNLMTASPEMEFERTMQRDSIEEAIQQSLSPHEQAVWVGRHLDDRSRKQLARALGVKPQSISKQLGRSRKKLKSYLLNSDF